MIDPVSKFLGPIVEAGGGPALPRVKYLPSRVELQYTREPLYNSNARQK